MNSRAYNHCFFFSCSSESGGSGQKLNQCLELAMNGRWTSYLKCSLDKTKMLMVNGLSDLRDELPPVLVRLNTPP